MSNIVRVKDAIGDETPVNVQGLCITENLKELPTLAFTFVDTPKNTVGASMMQPLSTVYVPEVQQTFRIVNVSPTRIGRENRSYAVNAVHIATALHDRYIDERLTGTQSLDACMRFITNGTKFNYVIHDSFKNYSFSDGFGTDFADSLFMSTLSGDFGFEFWFDNYTIHIAKTIGKVDNFMFVSGLNGGVINWQADFSNVRTYIKGNGKPDDNGKPRATAEYLSPSAKIWGKMQAATISDERFTDSGALLEYIKNQLQDYPIVQYTMDRVFFDNNNELSNYNDVKVGDYGYIKDRDVDIDIRVIGKTYYPQDPSQTDVLTFGNKTFDFNKQMIAQQRARNQNGQLGKSVNALSNDFDTIKNDGLWYTAK